MRFRRSMSLYLAFLACSVCACAQSTGNVTKDEHDKQIRLDTKRNTEYHNNADDYPKNTPAPAPVRETRPAAPYLTSSDIHDMYARADAARAEREAEFNRALSSAQSHNEEDMMKVADYLQRGFGTQQNTKLAMDVYGAVVKLGPRQAYRVGSLLSSGGPLTDNVEAYHDMKISAEGGYEPARKWLETHKEPPQQRNLLPSMLTFTDEMFRSRGVGIAPTSPGKGDAVLAELKKVYEARYTNFKKSYKLRLEALAAGKATLYGLGVPADPKAAAELIAKSFGVDPKSDYEASEYAAWAQWALFKQSGSKDYSKLGDGAGDPAGNDYQSTPMLEYVRAVYSCATGNVYRQREHLVRAVTGVFYDGKHYYNGPLQLNTDLAVMELEGLGGSLDEASGMKLLQEAATKGDANAKYVLGLIYEGGLHGVGKDPNQAAQFFQAAAASGQPQAKQKLTKSASLARP